jgi:deazaflavin-dependent oxidoreductase (nitroreductase family)
MARNKGLNWWRRMLVPLAASPLGSLVVRYFVQPIDRLLLPLSRGRVSFSAFLYPTLMLTTIGARSGQPRRTPLIFLPDGERFVLIASNFGGERHPAWYYNLRANPVAQVTLRGRTRAFIAHEAGGVEREELWQRAVAYYPGYRAYQRRTGGRAIPIMVLAPRP